MQQHTRVTGFEFNIEIREQDVVGRAAAAALAGAWQAEGWQAIVRPWVGNLYQVRGSRKVEA